MTNGGPLMPSPQPSAVEELLARWEASSPGTPVRPVVQRAVDLGFTVVPPRGSRTARYLRLVYDPPAGRAVTLYVDAVRLTAAGAAVREVGAALPGAVLRTKDVQFPFGAADPGQVLQTIRSAATGEPIAPPVEPVQPTGISPHR
jgi:hypothetical protein